MKYVGLFVFALLISVIPSSVAMAQAVSEESQIAALMKQVEELTEQLKKLSAQNTELSIENANLKFQSELRIGAKGDDVAMLQKLLATDPSLYPEGLVTGYFGSLTETAVKRFQEKFKIEQVGIVGPQTLARINEILTSAGITTEIPTDLLGSRVEIKIEIKDGKEEIKIKVKGDDDETDEDEDVSEDDEDEDESESEDEDEDSDDN